MTLILALACADGIVMASDGQATYSTAGQPVKQPIEKLKALGQCIVWGGAGDVGVLQKVGYALEPLQPQQLCLPIAQLRPILYQAVRPVMIQALQNFISIPGTQPPVVDLLFCGYWGREPWILEIDPQARDVQHEDAGFAAVGSGDIFPYFAMTSLVHYGVRQRNILQGQLIAYRVVDDAINTAAQGLGPPIGMWVAEKPLEAESPAEVRKLLKDELRRIELAVAEWKKIESSTLSETLGLRPEEPAT